MDRHQVRFAMLKITAVVLLGTSWVFGSFIYASRPEASTPADALGAIMRLPASLPSVVAPTTKVLPPIEMNVMPISCWDGKENSALETGARWIRLTGKACAVEGSAENVSVKNLTNGYTSTVFAASGQLTTDFIPLQAGANDILIRFESSPGVSVESRFILRRF